MAWRADSHAGANLEGRPQGRKLSQHQLPRNSGSAAYSVTSRENGLESVKHKTVGTMPVRIIESKQNPRLKELRKALAEPARNQRGVAGIEGPNLLDEARHAGLSIRCVFVARGSELLLSTLRLPEEVEVLAMAREVLDSALTTETPQPVAALVETPDWTWAHLLPDQPQSPLADPGAGDGAKNRRAAGAALILVLAGLQDPGNLGTILRSAEAFGAHGVVCLPGTANAWNPKSVRASAGSIFRIPLLNVGEDEALTELREAGIRILTTTAQSAQAADTMELTGPVALLIGNEGNGVPAELAAKADGAVTIPCPGPVESLNVAVATSLLLYEASRQRAAINGSQPRLRGGSR